jgi:hypothetical protein
VGRLVAVLRLDIAVSASDGTLFDLDRHPMGRVHGAEWELGREAMR